MFEKIELLYNGIDQPEQDLNRAFILVCNNGTWTLSDPPPLNDPPVCFVRDTIVQTDQGSVLIQDVKQDGSCTIDGSKVKLVTSQKLYKNSPMVKVAKGALGHNVPDKDTVCTRWHPLLVPAYKLVGKVDGVTEVSFEDHTPIYNVLVEGEGEKLMKANGLKVATLDPKHPICRFQKK